MTGFDPGNGDAASVRQSLSLTPAGCVPDAGFDLGHTLDSLPGGATPARPLISQPPRGGTLGKESSGTSVPTVRKRKYIPDTIAAPVIDAFDIISRVFADGNIDLSHLALSLPRLAERSRCSLGEFARRSLLPPSQAVPRSAADVWPCPPPPGLGGEWRPCSGRRRERMRQRGAARSLVQFVVCALNWMTLGFATEPPDFACVGAPVTTVQQEHIDRLERFCSYAVRLGRGPGSDLGRSLEKYRASESVMQNLAASAIRLEQAYGTSAGIPASTHETPLREEVDH